jgi:hypothetical protein
MSRGIEERMPRTDGDNAGASYSDFTWLLRESGVELTRAVEEGMEDY